MAEVGAWVRENCSSVGFDDITLTGALNNFTTFSSAIPEGQVWYSIEDLITGNREEGIGYFDGASALVRQEIHTTLESGVYITEDPLPIDLSGKSVVSCTLNSKALEALLAGVTTPVVVAPNEPIYREIDDFSTPDTYYKGWSDSADTSAATWKILRGEEIAPGVFSEKWADGNDTEDNIWDNRVGLSYT